MTTTWLAVISVPESRLVFSAIASRNSGNPTAGVYLWFLGSFAAAIAASTMWAGVGKSGSPAAYEITGLPAACKAFALASTLRVADSAIEPMRWEILGNSFTSLDYRIGGEGSLIL